MRLFLAAQPPDGVCEHLDAFLDARRDAPDGPRWTGPAQWHITLAFLGTATERSYDRLVERVHAVASRTAPTELRLTGGGAFPNPYAARVLWVGIGGTPGEREGEQVADLVTLAGRLRRAASAAGASPDGTRFHPHVTVGRFRSPVEATRWIRVLAAYDGPAFVVDEVVLVESHLGGASPRHEVRERFVLRGSS